MADQGRWFKLWVSAPSDPSIQALSPALRWAWAALGCYTKLHGTRGQLVINSTNPVLAAEMGVMPDQLLVTMRQLPHVRVEEGKTSPGLNTVTWQNWAKYQEDPTVAQRMRRYRQNRSSVAGLPREIAESIWKRDDWRCVYCGLKVSQSTATIDHVVPLARGGTNRENNLVTACGRCNESKNEYCPEECDLELRFAPEEVRNAYRNATETNAIKAINDPKKRQALRYKKRREEKRREEKRTTQGTPLRGVLADDEFLDTLKKNPAYATLDLDTELGKLDAWLLTPRGRGKKKTRRRLVAWLNRALEELPLRPAPNAGPSYHRPFPAEPGP